MKIQYASDLHLEFPENKKYLEAHPLQPAADVLILAGDIVPFAEMEQHTDFFDYLDANWEQVYWIPGNHEHYRGDIGRYRRVVDMAIRDHVTLLNNSAVRYGEVRILFSTLWSHISPANEMAIYTQLNDFGMIRDQSKGLTVSKYNALHQEGLGCLKAFFETPHKGKTVVVTHHVPTYVHYPNAYKGDALNEAFATELFDFIDEYQPAAWIYGHHHSNVPGFAIGKTRMLTNQLGYVGLGEDEGFDPQKILDI